jgi:hypothetical protein
MATTPTNAKLMAIIAQL